jgi:hypothetical protein
MLATSMTRSLYNSISSLFGESLSVLECFHILNVHVGRVGLVQYGVDRWKQV